MMLPNLLVIGATKAGTTSLHAYLDRHPDIQMAWPKGGTTKEMRYFWRDDWQHRRGWYEQHFDGAPVRGEATPAYTHFPVKPHVPERIHSLIPDAKLIYLVRDPIDRIASHWVQAFSDGQWAEIEAEPDHPLVCPSMYATQIREYLRFFPSSQLLVIDQHDLRHARGQTLSRVFRFLGVDDEFQSRVFDVEKNVRADKRRLTRLGAPIWRRAVAPTVSRLPGGTALAEPAKRMLSRKVTETPTIDLATQDRLRELLEPEVAWLREFTGHDFANWSL
jgi:hypothetical protein